MQTQQREAAAKGVVWLTVASSAPGEQGFVTAAGGQRDSPRGGGKRNAAPAAFLLDPQSKIARAYGATVTPHMYIIDASGVLVYKGGIDLDPVLERRQRAEGTRSMCAPAPRPGAGRQTGAPRPRPGPTGCTLKYGNNAA